MARAKGVCEKDDRKRKFYIETYNKNGSHSFCNISDQRPFYQHVYISSRRGSDVHVFVHAKSNKGKIDVLNDAWQDTVVPKKYFGDVDFEIEQSSSSSPQTHDTLELTVWFCPKNYADKEGVQNIIQDIEDDSQTTKITTLYPKRILS